MAVIPKSTGMGYAQVIAAAPKVKPVTPYATPNAATQGVPGPIPQANLNQATGYAGAIAAASAYKPPVATPMMSAGGTAGKIPPMYGANVIGNVDTNPESQIAGLGTQWAAAKTQAEKDAIHSRANQIGTDAGGAYDPRTGKWTFADNQRADTTATAAPVAATAPVFTAPTPTQQIPTASPAIPVMDEAAIRKYATDQIAAKLAKLRQSADQSITSGRLTADRQLAGLKTGFDRQLQTMGEDRALQDDYNDRQLSPFSGRSDYARGMIAQERGRTDREMNADNLSRQANVQQDAANLEQTINQKYALMQQLAPDEQEAMFQSIKSDERQYELMLRGELRSDTMANSQLNDTQFNQSLAGYNANRSAFESDRGFSYDQYRDQVNWTGNIPGGGSAAQGSGAQGFAAQGAQGGQAFGAQNAPMRTLQGQQFDRGVVESDRDYAHTVAREGIADKRYQQEFDYNVKKDGLDIALKKAVLAHQISNDAAQNAISGMNASTSRINAGTNAGSLAWSKDPTNPDNILKSKQIGEVGKPDLSKSFNDLSSMYVAKDPYTGASSVTNPTALRSAIIGMGLSDGDTDQMLLKFGLQPN